MTEEHKPATETRNQQAHTETMESCTINKEKHLVKAYSRVNKY